MIKIDNTIVSDDLLNVRFCCDLNACKGECCVDGDAGAPLDEEEISILEDHIDKIKPYMSPESMVVVERMGVFDYDMTGKFCTPLVNDRECVFVVFDEFKIARCAIEMAYKEGKIKFQKPVSCHLYPVRITCYDSFDAVNYHKWHICQKALDNGARNNIPLYEFLKDALLRKYGRQWYNSLLKALK